MFPIDCVAGTDTSVKGTTIDLWYSGKRKNFGRNVQAVMRPDGFPIWTSPVSPGHLHDLTVAVDNRAYNMLLRAMRCQGEHGFTLLYQRWHALQCITAGPTRIWAGSEISDKRLVV